ncbi:hypothetical protein GCM10023074_38770 [Microbispora amethystogenes]|uniref:Uncharacterized protein n=1 Tax=Microbispora amethystogenes TaxID=1427754 RepID=A0ABQ4FB74_9ACTN|nr:hypothetical protein Mam01_22400 [Microbispora amethystogenes]
MAVTGDLLRAGQAATASTGAQPALDYYVITPEAGAGAVRAEGLVVEEFVFTGDHRTIGLNTAAWSTDDRAWQSSAAFGRAMREDPRLRAHVAAVGRTDAETTYRRLGGGALPGETELRECFRDTLALPDSAPLRLGPEGGSDGFPDSRVYRVLFAGDLRLSGLACLAPEVVTLAEDAGDPRTRIAGTGGLRTARDVFTWELRRIGPGVACCVDLTAHLGTTSDDALRPLLRRLTTAIRHAGPIPVTIERFS